MGFLSRDEPTVVAWSADPFGGLQITAMLASRPRQAYPFWIFEKGDGSLQIRAVSVVPAPGSAAAQSGAPREPVT